MNLGSTNRIYSVRFKRVQDVKVIEKYFKKYFQLESILESL